MTMTSILVVIWFVGAAVILGVLGIIVLAYAATPVPDELKIITVSALTGLIGLLAPSPSRGR